MTRTDAPAQRGVVGRLKATRGRIRSSRAGRIAMQAVVGVLGIAVIVVGIVLLPLPGPGWLIIFAGLGILATEFAWAARLLRFARTTVSRWTTWMAAQGRLTQVLVGFVGVVVLAAAFVGVWWIYIR